MLKQMRGFAQSWVARTLLLVLAVAMSITITQGQGDILAMLSNFTGPRGVADVAGYNISPQQLSRELDLTLRVQRQRGQNMTQAEAVERGVHMQLLERLIARRALAGYAEKLGIRADNSQVAEAIRQIPAVRSGVGGGFDRQSYLQFLQTVGYNQLEFENEQRGDVETAILLQALTDGVRAPASFGKLVLAFESETRTLSVAEAPATLTGNIPAPDAAQIQAFYEDNAEAFRVPEYRQLTLVYARASDFVARVDVPEARIREEFESRRTSLTQPERRSYVRLAATSEQQARDAAARIGRGETPDAVARALSMQISRGENQTRQDVADSAVGAAVFSTPVNAPARAVQARLTPWAVVKVNAITPAVEPSFERERDGIRNAIAADEAADMLNEAVQAFDDARSGGMAVADAGRAHNLQVVQVAAIDARGLKPDGQPEPALVDQAELITMAFATAEGETSDFTPSGDADVVVFVDHITPSTTRPLEQVRNELVAGWTARERARRLAEIGREITTAVTGGQRFEDVVRARGLTMRVRSQPLDRRTAGQLPSREFGPQVFNARVGDVVTANRIDGGALFVAHVEAINRANPDEHRDVVEQGRVQMQQALSGSLVEAITAAAVEHGHARRNETLIRQTFATAQTGEEGTPPPQ